MGHRIFRARMLRLTMGAALGLTAAFASIVRAGAGQAATGPFLAASAPEMRVAAIGYRLATTNLTRCPRAAPATGLVLHDAAAYNRAVRAEIQARYEMGSGLGVLGVVPGSAAHRVGLTAGDEIVALDGVQVGELALPAMRASATYDRVEAFEALLAAGLAKGAAVLGVRRGANMRTVSLPLVSACAARVTTVPGSKPDAWSDGRYAAVTRGLAEVADDDELAFALGHEMAHVVLGHAAETHGPLTRIGIGGRRSRDRERAADRLGIAMVIGSGYDPAGAQAFLERLSRSNGSGFSLTHPSVSARLAAMRQAAMEAATATPAR